MQWLIISTGSVLTCKHAVCMTEIFQATISHENKKNVYEMIYCQIKC